MIDPLLQEQVDYYRARAGEYDDWWLRRGRYDRGPEWNARWFAEAAQVRAALQAMGHCRDTLELACGTGLWTEELARRSDRVVALDASPEVIELNRLRNAACGPRITYHCTDLFAWEPRETFDLVFAGFWFSHVPVERLDAFLDRVARATRPGGRVFVIDSLYATASTAKDHVLAGKEQPWQRRRLEDGREFRIVKIFHEPAALAEKFRTHGFETEAGATENFFLHLRGIRRR